MQLLDIAGVGVDHIYKWPSGKEEPYPHWVEYRAAAVDGEQRVRIAFDMRSTYGRERRRVVVWIDNYPQAEFLAESLGGRVKMRRTTKGSIIYVTISWYHAQRKSQWHPA